MSYDYDTGECHVRQFESVHFTVEFAERHNSELCELSIQDNNEDSVFGESYINLRYLTHADIVSLRDILNDIIDGPRS